MNLHKVTPIYLCDAITPAVLAFWAGSGWTKVVEVPHGDAPGFALLVLGEQSVMLQTHSSWAADVGVAASAALYVDVGDLDAARAEAEGAGATVLIRERTTFYGAREAWVRAPGDLVIGYAVHPPA